MRLKWIIWWTANVITDVLTRRQKISYIKVEGSVVRQAETGVQKPQTKECQQLPEAGRSKR